MSYFMEIGKANFCFFERNKSLLKLNDGGTEEEHGNKKTIRFFKDSGTIEM
ncbi:hypothetical protein JCM37173_33740 [Allocoprococcus similis]